MLLRAAPCAIGGHVLCLGHAICHYQPAPCRQFSAWVLAFASSALPPHARDLATHTEHPHPQTRPHKNAHKPQPPDQLGRIRPDPIRPDRANRARARTASRISRHLSSKAKADKYHLPMRRRRGRARDAAEKARAAPALGREDAESEATALSEENMCRKRRHFRRRAPHWRAVGSWPREP